jgi:hypothetical protein
MQSLKAMEECDQVTLTRNVSLASFIRILKASKQLGNVT